MRRSAIRRALPLFRVIDRRQDRPVSRGHLRHFDGIACSKLVALLRERCALDVRRTPISTAPPAAVDPDVEGENPGEDNVSKSEQTINIGSEDTSCQGQLDDCACRCLEEKTRRSKE